MSETTLVYIFAFLASGITLNLLNQYFWSSDFGKSLWNRLQFFNHAFQSKDSFEKDKQNLETIEAFIEEIKDTRDKFTGFVNRYQADERLLNALGETDMKEVVPRMKEIKAAIAELSQSERTFLTTIRAVYGKVYSNFSEVDPQFGFSGFQNGNDPFSTSQGVYPSPPPAPTPASPGSQTASSSGFSPITNRNEIISNVNYVVTTVTNPLDQKVVLGTTLMELLRQNPSAVLGRDIFAKRAS